MILQIQQDNYHTQQSVTKYKVRTHFKSMSGRQLTLTDGITIVKVPSHHQRYGVHPDPLETCERSGAGARPLHIWLHVQSSDEKGRPVDYNGFCGRRALQTRYFRMNW